MVGRGSKNFFAKWWWQNDTYILLACLFLFLTSIVLVMTTSPFVAMRIGIDPLYFVKNHILYIIISIFTIVFFSSLSKKYLVLIINRGFIFTLILMLGLLLFGTEVNGSKRWIYIFGISIQPSEFMKVLFPCFLGLLWKKYQNNSKKSVYLYFFITYFSIILLLVLQPDVGMAILISSVFIGVLFITGIKYIWFLLTLFIVYIVSFISYFIFPHVQYRIKSFLFEEKSYQVTKSLEAIFNGKIFGQGAGQGFIKHYLPDSHTDFIFSVSVEEFGLLFSIILIIIYAGFILRIFYLVQQQKESFRIISLIGMMIILFTQIFIHIGSNINLIPTKGMTLPLISYGGSSLVATAVLIGIVLNFTRKDIGDIVLKH